MAEPNTDLGLTEATNALEGLLAREEGDTEQAQGQETASSPADEAAQETVQETPESAETPAQAEAEPEETAETEEQPQETEETPLYTVKVDGKEKQVTLDELQRGYSGQQWITQRSQSLAAERKALEAEATAVRQERAQYAQVLGELAKQLQNGGEAEPDWEKLRAEDEFKFVVERQAWQLKQDRLNAIKAEQSRVAGLQQKEQENARARMIEEENRKVLEVIPAWKDKAVAKRDIAELRAFALKNGWTEEEIDNATDHRAVRALWAEYQMSKLANTQRPRPVSRAPRSASPGAGTASPGRPAEITRDKQRLAQTGRVEDAAAIFEKAGIFE